MEQYEIKKELRNENEMLMEKKEYYGGMKK